MALTIQAQLARFPDNIVRPQNLVIILLGKNDSTRAFCSVHPAKTISRIKTSMDAPPKEAVEVPVKLETFSSGRLIATESYRGPL